MTREDKKALLEFIAALVLWLAYLLVPWFVFHRFSPLWGLGSAVAAFALYAWLGRAPSPASSLALYLSRYSSVRSAARRWQWLFC